MIQFLENKLKPSLVNIVFPEGENLKILKAASKLVSKGYTKVFLLGDEIKINQLAKDNNLEASDFEIINPLTIDTSEMAQKLFELRQGKNPLEECQQLVKQNNYYATMLVKLGVADTLLGGINYSTGDIIKPALQIIKPKKGMKTVSSYFIMVKNDIKYLMADCAINIDPNSEQLKDITICTANSAKMFDIEPNVALLSFSTHGSAKSPQTEKIDETMKLLNEEELDFVYDGELQFDTAVDKEIRLKKAPNSKLKENANVFIFPDLNSGNIGYKITSQLAGYQAIGPIVQGLDLPVNDLSRGSSEEEIYLMSLICILQVQSQE